MVALIAVRRVRTGIDAVDRALDALVDSLRPLLTASDARHVDVTVSLATGANTVYHGLGRLPRGWSVQDVYTTGTTTPTLHRQAWTSETATVYCTGAACSAVLRFY